MRTKLLTLFALLLSFLSALMAPAAAEHDAFTVRRLRPLLQIHALGSTIAGQRMVQDVFLYRNGAVLASYTQGEPGEDSGLPAFLVVERGAASSQALDALNEALARGQVGVQRGGCGQAFPDSFATLQVTWYGASGRTNTFTVGADASSCPEGMQLIVAAIDELVTAVRNDPNTEVFRSSQLP